MSIGIHFDDDYNDCEDYSMAITSDMRESLRDTNEDYSSISVTSDMKESLSKTK